MKKLLLLLLISLSFGSQAYDDCYETRLTGVKAFQGRTGEIVKTLEGTIWEVRYDAKSLNAYGSEILVCNGRDNSGAAYLIVKGYKIKVKRVGHVNGNSNAGRATVDASYQAGANVATGLISFFESLAGLSSNNTQNSNNSIKPRLFDFGTTVRFSTDNDVLDIVSSSNGFKCRVGNNTNICTKGSYRVTFSECGYFVACGTDGTKFTINQNSDNRAVTTSFGSACSIDMNAMVFRCR